MAPTTPVPPPIALSVVHGSLDDALHPLLVGHYQQQGLSGAIERVDAKLGGRLREALALGVFRGALGTSIAFLGEDRPDGPAAAWPGAIVVGLGDIGSLTPTALADAVAGALQRHAFEARRRGPRADAGGLAVSSLLIGSHVQAVTPRESLAALLQGAWAASAQGAAAATLPFMATFELIEMDASLALDAAYEARRLLARPDWAGRFHWQPPLLATRPGALVGYRPADPMPMWQRLAIRSEGDASGGMQFELTSTRARVEASRVPDDAAGVDAAVDDAVARQAQALAAPPAAPGAAPDDSAERFGRLLYQRLLPHSLRARLNQFEPTVLLVDDRTARLPWELLVPDPDPAHAAAGARPLAVQAGLMRQRLTSHFRAAASAPTGWDALVIGDPDAGGWTDAQVRPIAFAPLDGADAEARAVRGLLASDPHRGWTVHPWRRGASADVVRAALVERPWRLLHLAGHGVVDQWLRPGVRATGLVLSGQQVLDAAAVEQIPVAPELVFINACSSGRDGRVQPAASGASASPALAASLALKFIQMGSRSVIAAGWPIDDADAQAFALALYRALLGGTRLGDAVREARQHLHALAPERQTWGAYQCYGDPQWRLDSDVGVAASGGTLGRHDWRFTEAARCMSDAELADRIRQLVPLAGDLPGPALARQIDGLVAALRRDTEGRARWLARSAVQAALGEAYREAGAHLQAVQWLRRAGKGSASVLQLRQIEGAVQSLSRLTAAERAQVDDAVAAAAASAAEPAMADATERLPDGVEAPADTKGQHAHHAAWHVLDALQRLDAQSNHLPWDAVPPAERVASAASERLCLRGGDALHRAAQATGTRRDALLAQAAALFARGFRMKNVPLPEGGWIDRPTRRAHALSSAMIAASLLAWRSGAAPCADTQATDAAHDADAAALLDEFVQGQRAVGYWRDLNVLELRFARALSAVAAGRALDGALDSVQVDLARALARWPSPAELESLAFRLALMRATLAHAPHPQAAAAKTPEASGALRHAVAQAIAMIEAHVRGLDAAADEAPPPR